jgi:hypothetical protein
MKRAAARADSWKSWLTERGIRFGDPMQQTHGEVVQVPHEGRIR